MTRRSRLTAGILAFLAMTVSLAENVLASTCAAPMPEMTAGLAGDSERMADDCMFAIHGDEDDEGGEQRNEGQRHCPFSPAMAVQGCTAAALLPASSSPVGESSSESMVTIVFTSAQHDLLLSTALFHPPKL